MVLCGSPLVWKIGTGVLTLLQAPRLTSGAKNKCKELKNFAVCDEIREY
jgi:hypothetical protein